MKAAKAEHLAEQVRRELDGPGKQAGMGSLFPFKETILKCDLPGVTEISRNRGLKGVVRAKCGVRQLTEERRQTERQFWNTLLLFRLVVFLSP